MKVINTIMIAFLAIIIQSCLAGEVYQEAPKEDREISFCTYDIENICVMEDSRFIGVDPVRLAKILNLTEYEVNYYYPGLNISEVAEEHNFKIRYKWATLSTKYSGTYSDIKVSATVNVRRGEHITERMQCSDKYYVVMHEVLHFIVDRYIEFDYTSDDVHNVPYIFDNWTFHNNLPVDYTVEGRMYTMIRRMCND